MRKVVGKKGITLIALVITIIVLLILAGITISLTIGQDGIINKSQESGEKYNEQQALEEIKLKIMQVQINKKGKATLQDVVNYFDEDTENEYFVSLSKIANVNGIKNIGNVSEIFVIYKGYQFKIDSNLYVTFINNKKDEIFINYDANGGENPPKSQNRSNTKISSHIPSKEHYVFVGWGDSNTSTEVLYKAGDIYDKSEPITLYAIWREKTVIQIDESVENINTSVKVSNIENNVITIDNTKVKLSTVTGNFQKDDKIMIYVSNTNDKATAGKFEIYTITNINEDKIEVNENIDTQKFTNENCQIIKVLNYDEVIIGNDVIITPSKYDGESGGIIAINAINIVLNGIIDTSKCGYDLSNVAPNNGGTSPAGNTTSAGGSNKYQGGNGGVNYQGYVGTASASMGLSNDILLNKQMTFGGGSYNAKGGGIIYIDCQEIEISSEYAIRANGSGGTRITWRCCRRNNMFEI